MAVPKKRAVIVRCYSAGVHFGYLVKKSADGTQVKLEKSRRIWSWSGANSCSELATTGLDVANSRVAVPVDIEFTGVIEVIDCTKAAADIFNKAVWKT